MEQFDIVTATFNPKNRSDLAPEAIPWIGTTHRWCAGWLIEPEDGGPYVGQWAMTLNDPSDLPPIGWVPLCDLDLIEGQAA